MKHTVLHSIDIFTKALCVGGFALLLAMRDFFKAKEEVRAKKSVDLNIQELPISEIGKKYLKSCR